MTAHVAASVLAAGAVGSLAIGFALSATGSALAASVQRWAGQGDGGTLVLQERSADGSVSCRTDADTAAHCTTPGGYGGGVLLPGASSTRTTTMRNAGTVAPRTFTLVAGPCTQQGPGARVAARRDLCTRLRVGIYAGPRATGIPLFSGTPDQLATRLHRLAVLAPGASQAYTVVVSAPGDLDGSDQGMTAVQSLAWTMSG